MKMACYVDVDDDVVVGCGLWVVGCRLSVVVVVAGAGAGAGGGGGGGCWILTLQVNLDSFWISYVFR